MITGGFTENELCAMKQQIQMIRSDDKTHKLTHDCVCPVYYRHSLYCYCEVEISRKFTTLIQDLMGGPPKYHYMNARWIVCPEDVTWFDIFGPNVVVRICAGRIGILMEYRQKIMKFVCIREQAELVNMITQATMFMVGTRTLI